jgi:hypothetical protein
VGTGAGHDPWLYISFGTRASTCHAVRPRRNLAALNRPGSDGGLTDPRLVADSSLVSRRLRFSEREAPRGQTQGSSQLSRIRPEQMAVGQGFRCRHSSLLTRGPGQSRLGRSRHRRVRSARLHPNRKPGSNPACADRAPHLGDDHKRVRHVSRRHRQPAVSTGGEVGDHRLRRRRLENEAKPGVDWLTLADPSGEVVPLLDPGLHVGRGQRAHDRNAGRLRCIRRFGRRGAAPPRPSAGDRGADSRRPDGAIGWPPSAVSGGLRSDG